MKYDLSILIPARNEMFLAKTVENILTNIRGNTEIIVVLDGQWADPPVPQNERVTVLYNPVSVGQRAATNQAARISDAKYVMKCDAHVAFDEGFDVKMMADMQDDWTMVPAMYNLHAFDWVCDKCGHRIYQGPTPDKCDDCGGKMQRDIVWQKKESPYTTAMRFDRDLKFQYWGEYKKKQKGDLVDTMSLLGACWMLTRDKYWELNICDELHGSWGQQGTEVACKTWLSGGRLVVTKKTWFAHMFRTQGGDFGFPYPLSGGDVEKARDYSKNLWLGNNWSKAKHDLKWLIEKFSPPGWEDYRGEEEKIVQGKKSKKGVVYYSDGKLEDTIGKPFRCQILEGIKEKHVVNVSLSKIDFGLSIYMPLERGWVTMVKQILTGLVLSNADTIFFCEHDVLYHPSHFDFIPPKKDVYYYNTNVWRVRYPDGHSVKVDDLRQLSGLVADRELLINHFRERLKRIETEGYSPKIGFEPGTHGRSERIDDFGSEVYQSKFPNLDIRHGENATPSRWDPSEFRNKKYTQGWTESNVREIPGWESLPLF